MTREVDLETHINDVANLMRWEELENVVLVGHSYAGCVIGGVADRMPERIAKLVYLDAFILEDGQCLYDVFSPEHRAQQIEAAAAFGEGWRLPPPTAASLYVNPADQAWVDSHCTDHPIACNMQRIHLKHKSIDVAALYYIRASGWLPATKEFYDVAVARGWSTREIFSGHDVMVDRPQELTTALTEIAAG
jgi:pimeloyl-ACP methyl ester carboxylesterase